MRTVLLCLTVIASLSYSLRNPQMSCAAIPDQKSEDLQALATHVCKGRITKIYSTVDRSTPSWEYTYKLAEIQVERMEKGRHDGRLIYVRFWHRRPLDNAAATPGFNGHRDTPRHGASVLVYMREAKDGGYDVIPPNGFLSREKAR